VKPGVWLAMFVTSGEKKEFRMVRLLKIIADAAR
jgi:hypothetical protein